VPVEHEVFRENEGDEEDRQDEENACGGDRREVEPRRAVCCSDYAETDAQRDRAGDGEEHELERDGEAVSHDRVHVQVPLHLGGPEIEHEDVLQIDRELDKPGLVEVVVILQRALGRRGKERISLGRAKRASPRLPGAGRTSRA
jgi:hypothetical protein